MYDKLVQDNYDQLAALKDDDGAELDPEIQNMKKLAQGAYLLPQFPPYQKGKYKLSNLSRFGSQQQQMHAMQKAILRHEANLLSEKQMKENDIQEFQTTV